MATQILAWFIIAAGTGMGCSSAFASAFETQQGSAYGFTFGSGVDAAENSYIYIDGPRGRDVFSFGYRADFLFDVGINPSGELAGYGEATDDPFAYYAIYGLGGFSGIFTASNGWGDVGLAPLSPAFGSLHWGDTPMPHPLDPTTRPTILGISDDGVVDGVVRYYYSDGTDETLNVGWKLPDLPAGSITAEIGAAPTLAPEPGVDAPEPVALCGLGLAVMALTSKALARQ